MLEKIHQSVAAYFEGARVAGDGGSGSSRCPKTETEAETSAEQASAAEESESAGLGENSPASDPAESVVAPEAESAAIRN